MDVANAEIALAVQAIWSPVLKEVRQPFATVNQKNMDVANANIVPVAQIIFPLILKKVFLAPVALLIVI